MGDRMDYCGICQVRLTGPAPAKQHYDSVKHKKKEEIAKLMSTTSGCKCYCKVCNVACDTQVMLKIHEQSDRHLQTMKKVDNWFPDVVRVSSRLEAICLEKKHGADESVSVTQSSARVPELGNAGLPALEKYYELSGIDGGGKCYACQIELTSRKHAEQHLAGQKHQRAVKVAQAHKQFYGVTSLPHQERAPSSMCPCSSSGHHVTSGQLTGDQCISYLCSTETVPQRAFPLSQNSSLTINLIEDPIPVSSVSSQKPALPSYHKESIEPRPLLSATSLPSECSICNKKMINYEQLLLHNESEVHCRKVERMKSLRPSFDNTIWYPCPLCSKPLNSIKSLRSHFADAHQMPEPKINAFFDEQRTKTKDEHNPSTDLRLGKTGENFVTETQSTAETEPRRITGLPSTAVLPFGLTQSGFSNPEATRASDSPCFEYNLLQKGNLDSVDRGTLLSSQVHRSSPDKDMDRTDGSRSSNSPSRESLHNISTAVGGRNSGMLEKLNPIESDAGISKSCGKQSCLFHCDVCGLCLNSVQQRKDHMVGIQHLKKLCGTNTCMSSPKNGKFYCALCSVFMNTQKDYDIHMNGQQHTLKAAKNVPAPERDLEPVNKSLDRIACQGVSGRLAVSIPRSYQMELYTKAMETDTVCFLPTGTGKTLVSIMVMSHMLRLNPRRPAVFLVDKILLVLQQSEEIRKELGDQLFTRWNESTGKLEERKLRIAELCSGKQSLNESEIWQQDVVVITAAYYNNLLESGSLRWADNCLVVFDEVHHCVKQHPYRVILEKAGLGNMEPLQQPKILGLTASPAGKSTVKGTVTMLQGLLSRLGDEVKLITVEEPDTLAELQKYQSNTELVVREVEHSIEETLFRDTLRRYLLECWVHLKTSDVQLPDGDEQETIFGNLTKDNLEDHLSALTVDVASRLSDKLELVTGVERNVQFKIFKGHMEILSQALIALETLGMAMACHELAVLFGDYFGGFSAVAPLGLPCERLAELTRSCLDNQKEDEFFLDRDSLDEEPGREDLIPVFRLLVKEIVDRLKSRAPAEATTEDGEDMEKPLVLVLVRRRKDAQSLTKLLEKSKLLKEHGMEVTYVVGHGAGKDGMAVAAQERVLHDIREHRYQVIVATSVAEEGLDFPLCELVVQLNPPDTVRALVQIRGRARKKGSRFVAFCQTPEQKRNFDDLREQEEHMIEAVRQLTTANSETSSD